MALNEARIGQVVLEVETQTLSTENNAQIGQVVLEILAASPVYYACGDTVSTLTPAFRWGAVAGAIGYVVRIFAAGICTGSLLHTSPTLTVPFYEIPAAVLSAATTYSWTVQALHVNSQCNSAQSACCAFTTAT